MFESLYQAFLAVTQDVLNFMYGSNPGPVIFVSSVEATNEQTAAGITNSSSGYSTAMQPIGQADAAVGSTALESVPYSTRLRPVTDMQPIFDARGAEFRRISTFAYDTTRWDGVNAGTGQTTAVVQSIIDSLGTDRAYVQSRFRNAGLYDFQPNFLRPDIRINGAQLLRTLQDSHLSDGHAGDRSIGLPIGYELTDLRKFVKKVNSIDCHAQVAQEIEAAGTFFQRYMVLIVLDIRIWE